MLALALSVPAPVGEAPGGAGMTQLDWQFAASALQDIMQLVTVEVTGVDVAGEGVTVGGVVTACASRICSPSGTGIRAVTTTCVAVSRRVTRSGGAEGSSLSNPRAAESCAANWLRSVADSDAGSADSLCQSMRRGP